MRFYRDLNYEQLVALWRREELKRRASRPTVLFHNDFTPAVTSYIVNDDDGSTNPELSSGGTQDTSRNIDVSSGNVQVFLVIQIEEQGDDSSSNNTNCQLQFDPAGGTSWENITASSTNGVFGTADGNTLATDEDAWTTGNFLLTGEEGTAYDGLELTDDVAHTAGTFDWQAANYTEIVFCITLDADNLSDSQSLTFAVDIGGTTITNDVTPTITITKSGTPPSGTLSGEIQALSMTAAGEQQFLGTCDFQGQPAELAASAHMVPEAAADLSMQDAELDAAGVQVFVGTGDAEIQIAELVAVGQEIFLAAGDFVFGSTELVAVGLLQPAGVGDIVIQLAELDAAGTQVFVGTADLRAQLAELDAAGVMQPAGTGDLQAQEPQLDAEGAAGDTTTGTATFERLTNP